ncbi:hypothetical protein GQE99_10245 [Maritimibacter sp. DP07]|uniref:Uncharacterized protein n=1 Tax=Maritimibacter harenae TaxID=2606218 RepID=A0A845M1E9_9RHOB|nr:hypothetical protein [Maritimibacter harenae]MZR13396.1 hypothetical protein [Maritimibacter harenae]
MRHEDIGDRNRANAQKSTGPRTNRGKAVVAGNARRHGATAKPDPWAVMTWYAIILDEPDVFSSGSVIPRSDREVAALTLAQSEAALAQAKQSLIDFEEGWEAPCESLEDLRNMRDHIREVLLEHDVTTRDMRRAMVLLDKIRRHEENDTAIGGKRHRLLQRYHREARSRRRRAFEAWIEVNSPGEEA